MNPRERLDELEDQLDRLTADNEEVAIVVEGVRDERALRALGLQGPILLVNAGKDLLTLSEVIAADHRRVILLVDWDRTGGRLARRLQEVLEVHGVVCDVQHRRVLSSLVRREVQCIEDLPGFVERLRERVGVPPRAR